MLVHVKALFTDIRRGDIAAVTRRIDADPSLVDAVATAPPKSDDGQSALQVAIKTGAFAIAELLIDRGADVRFVDRSDINSWNTPVVHDAIRAAVMSSRFGRNHAPPGDDPRIEIANRPERFEAARSLLERMIEAGADVTAVDSFGNDGLGRCALDAEQVIDEPVNVELDDDLTQLFSMLFAAGADAGRVDPRFGVALSTRYADRPVGRYLTP